MKNQELFSTKDKSKKLKCRLLHFLFDALRVNDKCRLLFSYFSMNICCGPSTMSHNVVAPCPEDQNVAPLTLPV